MIHIIMLSVPDGLIGMYITLSYLKRDQTPGAVSILQIWWGLG